MRSTTSLRPSPTTFRFTVGRAWCLGVLVFSGWAGCQANSDGFSNSSDAQGGKASGTAGHTGGALATGGQVAPDAAAGSPALDAGIPLLGIDAAGGATVPPSTGTLARDAGSSGLTDALGGTIGTGGLGGKGTGTTATGGTTMALDAGTAIDAPIDRAADAGGGFAGNGGATTGGSTGGKVSSSSGTKGGTTGGNVGGTPGSSASSSGGASGGTVSTPVDAGIDASVLPDAHVPSDAHHDAVADASPWHLVWADEFDREANAGAVAGNWNVSTWEPGTVNGEEQKYTARPQNVFHDGAGHLILRALNDSYSVGNATYPYTSGRIQSDGKFEFKFGRIEIRAKLPAGKGSFPGMLLMGTNGGWPECGEIGLMEQYGQDKTSLLCSTYSGSQADISQNVTFPTTTYLSQQFHTYALDWYEDHMVFFIDDVEVARRAYGATSPFANGNNDFYIILNVALGGTRGGTIEDGDFPMDMVMDYVRVYSL
jgi:beta-glucanase (GH16 family)